jgi:hypothetical protein
VWLPYCLLSWWELIESLMIIFLPQLMQLDFLDELH